MRNHSQNVVEDYGLVEGEQEVIKKVFLERNGNKTGVRGSLSQVVSIEEKRKEFNARKELRGFNTPQFNIGVPNGQKRNGGICVSPLTTHDLKSGVQSNRADHTPFVSTKPTGWRAKYLNSTLAKYINREYADVTEGRRLLTFLSDVGMNIGIVATLALVAYVGVKSLLVL